MMIENDIAANSASVEIKKESENEEVSLEQRQKELIRFIKQKKEYLAYVALTILLWVAYQIRVSNLPLLKDVTTGKLVSIELDSFNFLRYAKYYLAHGTFNFWDTMRYYPYGFEPWENLLGVSYFSVYFYKIGHFFSETFTIDTAHVLYPPVAFIIGMIFFYLLVKRLFDYRVALLASATLAFIPSYLFRTIAGFSDKEALGFMFYFMTLYFYIYAYQEKSIKKSIFLGVLSGLSTVLMTMSWGGTKFVFLTIGGFTLLEIMLNKFTAKDFYMYLAWFCMILILPIWLPRVLNFSVLLTSFTSSIITIALATAVVYFVMIEKDLLKIKNRIEHRVAPGLFSLILTLALGILLLSVVYGADTVPEKITHIYTDMVSPYGNDRWQLTVAENHQPYVNDWVDDMGWLYVIMFFIASAMIFYELLTPIKNELKKIDPIFMSQTALTIYYALFTYLFAFSRYKQSATYFNGTSAISEIAYIGSFVLFILGVLVIYVYSFYYQKKLYEEIKLLDKNYIFLIIWFVIMLVAARGAIRLLMVLAPVTTILTAYLIFKGIDISLKFKDKIYRYVGVVLLVALVFSPYAFGSMLGPGYLTKYYLQSSESAKYMGPSYNTQWQYAGQWIRDNTPKEAVFIHWWDYGYWIQGGGERATVTDGGNAHGAWNYQVGRHVLTAQNETEALEVMYAHNVTHFLIIADEIGKYTAYSSIGSDANYDRYSWITDFKLDPTRTQEKRDETILFYGGGYMLDDDFIYEGQIYPRQGAGIGGIFIPVIEVEVKNGNETQKIQKFKQPTAAVFYNNQRKDIPIECIYINGVKTTFDTPGLKGCFRIVPTIENNQMNPMGAGLYVSEEGVKALWTNMYLFDKWSDAFKLVYDDSNNIPLALYQGRQIGPIRIWEVHYPKNFTMSEEKIKMYQGFDQEDPNAQKI
jgi:asparagine N-glycosylation enzyme membrane subunit Stt3